MCIASVTMDAAMVYKVAIVLFICDSYVAVARWQLIRITAIAKVRSLVFLASFKWILT